MASKPEADETIGRLRLVVDTNFFQECRRPEEIGWEVLGRFDTIELIVTSPVQGELDRQKTDQRPRVRRRALDANQRFRRILKDEPGADVVRPASPMVVLRLDVTVPSKLHPDVLDPSNEDDRIVATALALALAHPNEDIRLLSDDTRPAGKAKAVGLPFVWIPDEWKRDLGEDDTRKEVRRLREELDKERRHRPSVLISGSTDGAGSQEGRIVLRRAAFVELEDEELSGLEDLLRANFPAVPTPPDLIPRSDPHRLDVRSANSSLMDALASMTPKIDLGVHGWHEPTATDWQHYRGDHAEWLAKALDHLVAAGRVANVLTPWTGLRIGIRNDGTVPAERVLVRFSANGSIRIAPPPNGDATGRPPIRRLSLPPSPPMRSFVGGSGTTTFETTSPMPRIDPLRGVVVRNDTEEFRYRGIEVGGAPTSAYQLDCGLFRHGGAGASFAIDVYGANGAGSGTTASVSVEVQAANLPEIVKSLPKLGLTQSR